MRMFAVIQDDLIRIFPKMPPSCIREKSVGNNGAHSKIYRACGWVPFSQDVDAWLSQGVDVSPLF